MTEELREEMRRLREEVANLKRQIMSEAQDEHRKKRGISIDIEGPVHDYFEDVMQGVAEGVHGELERSIFIGPKGVRIFKGEQPFHERVENSISLTKVAEIMSVLGEEHRLKILDELMSGGKYVNELQDKLSEITTSTLSSHLSVLEESGLVVQEKVRGRYLITMPGRTAYKMAKQITRFLERRNDK